MLFFMVQVAVQSVKIEVIDEQEDDQRSGHAAGHYRKVVDVVDRQRHDDQKQVVDPHGSHQSVEPNVLNHFVFDFFAREADEKGADDRADDGDVVHYRFAEKPAVEIFAEEADRAAEQKCGNEDRPADFQNRWAVKELFS